MGAAAHSGRLAQLLPERDGQVVVAALDLTSANTGRLSVTYYNELMGSDFLQRLHDWDQYCCWYFGWDKYLSNAGIRSPKLEQIVTYAYGNPRREKGTIRMDVEDRVLGQQMQRLVACRLIRDICLWILSGRWFRRHLRPSVSAILKPRIGCGKIFSQQHVLLFKSTAMIFTRRSA